MKNYQPKKKDDDTEYVVFVLIQFLMCVMESIHQNRAKNAIIFFLNDWKCSVLNSIRTQVMDSLDLLQYTFIHLLSLH